VGAFDAWYLTEVKKIISLFFTVIWAWESAQASIDVQTVDQSQSFGYESIEDIHLHDSRIQDYNQWILSAGVAYDDRPFILNSSDNVKRVSNIISSFDVVNYGGAMKIGDLLSVGLTSAVVGAGWGANGNTYWAPEDTTLRLKWTFLSGHHWGFGLQPFVTLPTGNGNYYLSDGGFGAGGMLSFAFETPTFSGLLSGGYRYNNQAIDNTYQTLDYTQKVITEVGGQYRFSDRWSLNSEFKRDWLVAVGSSVNPNSLFIGPRYAYSRGVGIFGGVAFGNPLIDNDSNDYRIMAGIKFTRPEEPRKPAPPPVVKHCYPKDITPAPIVFTVRFRHNEAISISQDILNKIAAAVKQLGDKFSRVLVVGHTSLVGTPQYNKNLSYRRAESVRALIIKSGMPAKEVWSDGRGLEEPLVKLEKTEADQALNRRVEIKVEYKSKWDQICD